MRKVGFWAVIAVTLAVYLAMVLWSLKELARMAGGLQPFDLRPFGYSGDEGRAFLAAIGEPGRDFYRTVQHRLDLVFPGLLALSLILMYRRLAPPQVAIALSLAAIAGAGFDWAENAMVGRLLGAAAPDDLAITLASRMTQLKSLCVSVALVGLVVLLAATALRRWRG